jgi:hypothetical protein
VNRGKALRFVRLGAVAFVLVSAVLAVAEAPKKAAPSAESEEAFRATISPILLTRCSPCHAPGGAQYAALPFDKSGTIRSHAPGVLKRLKGDDKETVQAWLGEGSRQSKAEARK